MPLALSGVVAGVRGKHLLGPVDLEIGHQGLTIVMGPNGAGKTTLLRQMHGLQRVTSGTVIGRLRVGWRAKNRPMFFKRLL